MGRERGFGTGEGPLFIATAEGRDALHGGKIREIGQCIKGVKT